MLPFPKGQMVERSLLYSAPLVLCDIAFDCNFPIHASCGTQY